MSKQRSVIFIAIAIVFVMYSNCSGGVGGGSTGTNSTGPLSSYIAPSFTAALNITGNESYVVPISVGCGYINEPCVNVTVCEPGTNNCVTLGNILVDTGSVGLRVFASGLSALHLNQFTDASNHALAECQSYVDGSSDWGPVVNADIQVGSMKATSVNMQLIQSNFATAPNDCTNLDTDPSTNGFNGILGVGFFKQDCGLDCANNAHPNNRIYFNCPAGAGNCQNASVAVALPDQVTNPVSRFATDNNGVILQLPNVVGSGAPMINGYMVFGVGTQTNNTPGSSVQAYVAGSTGDFYTNFNGTQLSAFIDSGSNGLFFPRPAGLPDCTNSQGFFCPTQTDSFVATQISATQNANFSVSFNVINADNAINTGAPLVAFNDIAGQMSGGFDWGLPFFLGRTVFLVFEQSTSPVGKGPLWAY